MGMQAKRTVEAVTFSDGDKALGPERPFCVDVHCFTLAAALLHPQLARDTQRVAQLRLASSKLSEHLGDRASFDAA